MRRALALTGLAAALALSVVPSANAAPSGPLPCDPYITKVCVPHACFTAALVVSTVNEAAGQPLPPGFPHCID
jgi:hypothetical protein